MHSGGFLVKVSAKQMEQETAVPSYLLHIKSIDDDGDKHTKMWMSRGGGARGRLPRTMHRVKYMQSFPIGCVPVHPKILEIAFGFQNSCVYACVCLPLLACVCV